MFKTLKLDLQSQAFNNPAVHQAYCKNRSHKNRSLLSFSVKAAQTDDYKYAVVISVNLHWHFLCRGEISSHN